MTEPWPQATNFKNLVSLAMRFLSYANGQTDTQTHHTTSTNTWGDQSYSKWQMHCHPAWIFQSYSPVYVLYVPLSNTRCLPLPSKLHLDWFSHVCRAHWCDPTHKPHYQHMYRNSTQLALLAMCIKRLQNFTSIRPNLLLSYFTTS